jgi:hypothetical protein
MFWQYPGAHSRIHIAAPTPVPATTLAPASAQTHTSAAVPATTLAPAQAPTPVPFPAAKALQNQRQVGKQREYRWCVCVCVIRGLRIPVLSAPCVLHLLCIQGTCFASHLFCLPPTFFCCAVFQTSCVHLPQDNSTCYWPANVFLSCRLPTTTFVFPSCMQAAWFVGIATHEI